MHYQEKMIKETMFSEIELKSKIQKISLNIDTILWKFLIFTRVKKNPLKVSDFPGFLQVVNILYIILIVTNILVSSEFGYLVYVVIY